jgi:hypothetical protein
MQDIPFVISLSTAFAMGCHLLCDKAAVLLYILYKDQNVNGFKMEQVKVHELDGDVKSEGMKYAVCRIATYRQFLV